MADPMTNFLSGASLGVMPQTRFNIGPITDDYKRRMDFNASNWSILC